MSDTPRTDAYANMSGLSDDAHSPRDWADFARELEREVAALEREREAYKRGTDVIRSYAEQLAVLLHDAGSVLDYWRVNHISVTATRVEKELLPAIRAALSKNPSPSGSPVSAVNSDNGSHSIRKSDEAVQASGPVGVGPSRWPTDDDGWPRQIPTPGKEGVQRATCPHFTSGWCEDCQRCAGYSLECCSRPHDDCPLSVEGNGNG